MITSDGHMIACPGARDHVASVQVTKVLLLT